MKKRKHLFIIIICLVSSFAISAQKGKNGKYGDGPDSISPVGIIKGLTDEQLLETVQKQTFRFFWHGAHPYSGLALERSNSVLAEHYWDYINEAWDEPNFSHTEFGKDAGAIGGTGFGIMSTIVAVERGWIGRDTAVRRLINNKNSFGRICMSITSINGQIPMPPREISGLTAAIVTRIRNGLLPG